jgi:hypothetical protein
MFWFIIICNFSIILNHEIEKLNVTLIKKYEGRQSILFMIYINPLNKTQLKLLEDISEYKEIFKNITFGYIDLINDIKLLDYFKLTNTNDSGVIVYDFKNKQFYIKEEISNYTILETIIKEINYKKLNWNTNSIIEKIFYLVTGKRYGKLAKTYLSFGLCLFSIIFYTGMNIYSKRMERLAIEKRFKIK